MIKSYDIEYSGVVTDVINTLSRIEETLNPFVLKIWVDGTEIPFTVTDDDTIEFLQESIKITYSNGHKVVWLLYGIIMVLEVIK